jgi:Bacterial Ig domain
MASENRRWTDPSVLVPIIVATIAAIIGPTYVYYLLHPNPNSNPTLNPSATPATAPLVNPEHQDTKNLEGNQVPIVVNSLITIKSTDPIDFILNANDKDKNGLKFKIVKQPEVGNISYFEPSTGHGVYEPLTLDIYKGSDYFVYNVSDDKKTISKNAL